jgi:hypothetical protein
LKFADESHVGIPFDTDDTTFSLPEVPMRPPMDEVSASFDLYLINGALIFFCPPVLSLLAAIEEESSPALFYSSRGHEALVPAMRDCNGKCDCP